MLSPKQKREAKELDTAARKILREAKKARKNHEELSPLFEIPEDRILIFLKLIMLAQKHNIDIFADAEKEDA